MIPIHVFAGLLAIASGAVALYAFKGGRLHRKSGLIFVYAMMVMASIGAVMAAFKPSRPSVVAGVLSFYLVTTALLTVRRRQGHSGESRAIAIDWAAMLLALAAGIYSFAIGIEGINQGGGKIDGLPAAPAFFFGAIAFLAVLGDVRMMWARGLPGAQRIARHLWRMCFAMFIATASFFLGQPQIFPASVRKGPLLAIPVLLVLLLMFYWLARVLFTKWTPRATRGEDRRPMGMERSA